MDIEVQIMTTTPLKRIIIERGIKNRWLAEHVGLNETGISQIANGKRIPTLQVALRIARTLEVTVEELFGYVTEDVARDDAN